MRWYRTLLVLPVLVLLPLSAPAGFLFGRKAAKPDPATRVPELIVTVKTDGDESKRAAAAEELRQYDAAAYPDVIPILIDVMTHDAKPSVRSEAAVSLSKLRPINPQVGWALEQTASHDSSMRVRFQARSALMMYHVAGYRSPKTDEPPLNENAKEKKEKEAAPAGMPPAVRTTKAAPANRLVPVPTVQRVAPPAGRTPGETAPPPLAPEPASAPAAAPQTPLVPATPPALEAAPASAPTDVQGPDLTPPE